MMELSLQNPSAQALVRNRQALPRTEDDDINAACS